MKRFNIILIAIFLVSLCSYAQTRRALLVGISEYNTQQTNWSSIHGANDVALMNKALVGFKVTKLTNSAATYDNITKALNTLIQQTKAGDIIYLHFSGHGQPYEDLDGDEDDGWDEAFIPYDAQMNYKKGVYEGKNHLTDDKLHGYIEQLRKKAGKSGIVYVSIDACHSGESYRGGEFDDEDGLLVEDKFIQTLSEDTDDDDDEYERGSSTGFSLNDKMYCVSRSSAKVRGNIKSADNLAEIVMLESCLSIEKSKEIKIKIKGKDGKLRNFYCGPLSYSIYKVLTKNKEPLTSDVTWVFSIRTIFDKVLQPNNLQQLVIETSDRLHK